MLFHSRTDIKKQITKNITNKNDPSITIKKINGNKTIELNILFINSELIKFFHNFVVLI